MDKALVCSVLDWTNVAASAAMKPKIAGSSPARVARVKVNQSVAVGLEVNNFRSGTQ